MFTYSALLWFLPLAGLVVLIHLINMFRHRRVEWAALEFLLAGYRKSRTRILLQQLLLMLLRTLAFVAAVLMFAQPKLEGPLAEFFGGKPTHHIVLLDDSYSMNDRNAAQGGTPLFDDIKGLVRQIAENGLKRKTNDRLTLVRFSQANGVLHGEEPDIAELTLDNAGFQVVQETLGNLESSETAAGSEEPLRAAIHVLRLSKVRLKPVVYFLSDFRQRNWDNPAPLLKSLGEIHELGGMIRMVRATDHERPNLSIADLTLVPGIHAADVDLLLDATVVNHGQEDADNIHVAITVDGKSQSGQTIPKVKARDRTTPPLRFPVRLEGTQAHRVEVQLQPDAIPNDNARFLALDVPPALGVLLITPNRQASASDSAQYVRVALAPGGAKSGIHARVEPPSFLSTAKLEQFSAIFLLDVPKLDPSAIRALEDYVAAGGGLAMFFGPDADLAFARSELYKNGNGISPVAPLTEGTLPPDFLSQTPDMSVVMHPIFRLFGSGESSLLQNVKIEKYIAVEPVSSETEGTKPDVLATLRGGNPLVVAKSFGKGRTIAFLTTAAPVWNNWGRGNPSFVVVMLELAAWLSQRNRDDAALLVGAPLSLHADASQVEPKITIALPAKEDETTGGTASIDLDAEGRGTYPATHRSGFYEAVFREHSGTETKKLFAVNVDPKEGDTRLIEVGNLSELLRSVNLSIESAAGFSAPQEFTGARSLGDSLLFLVVLLLLAEAFLAGRLLPPTSR